jgi:predicted transport protein
MTKPKTFDALVRAGGPERFVREAAEQAAHAERQHWLESLERGPSPKNAALAELHAGYIRDLRRQLGKGQPLAVVREQTRGRVQRKRALGDWGEKKAVDLLERAGFRNVRDVNAESANHPFGDIVAERDGVRYLIGVKTRNRFQVSGLINPTYNVRKRGADVEAIARRHGAALAWVAIAVIPEQKIFSAFFGTIAQIEDAGERFSIPMRPEQTKRYECLSRPLEEFDELIRAEWSNGGYGRRSATRIERPPTPDGAATMPSFEDHVDYADPPIQPALRKLRARIIGLGRMREKVTPAQRIAYEKERDFCEVKVQKRQVLVRVLNTGLPDPRGIVTDIPKSHGWQYEKEIPIDSVELVDYVMPFIEASYRSSRANMPRR